MGGCNRCCLKHFVFVIITKFRLTAIVQYVTISLWCACGITTGDRLVDFMVDCNLKAMQSNRRKRARLCSLYAG